MIQSYLGNNQKPERDFTLFKKSLNDIASTSLNEYLKDKYKRKFVNTERKTSDEIDEILIRDSEPELRQLSQMYWNLSGLYRRLIIYMATMLTYDTIVVPKLAPGKKKDKEKCIKGLTEACYFIDSLNIEQEFARIFATLLIDGVYYGFFKECENGKYIFQDLEPEYCRTRFKSANGFSVLEFVLSFFVIFDCL